MEKKTEILLTRDEISRLISTLAQCVANDVCVSKLVIGHPNGNRRAEVLISESGHILVTTTNAKLTQVLVQQYTSQHDLLQAHESRDTLLHDDGEFFIEENANYEPGTGNVFLCKHCMPDLTTPGGFTCIGGADQHGGKNWRADIHQVPTEDTDCTTVYDGENRSAAIAELWARRNDAYVSSSIRY